VATPPGILEAWRRGAELLLSGVQVDARQRKGASRSKGVVAMVRRVLPLVAFVWMLVLGGVLLVGIGNPNLIGDPNVSPVCLVCGGRTGYFRDVGDLVVGIVTLGLGLVGLIITVSQPRGYEGPDR
jgi:hypothetical protein